MPITIFNELALDKIYLQAVSRYVLERNYDNLFFCFGYDRDDHHRKKSIFSTFIERVIKLLMNL